MAFHVVVDDASHVIVNRIVLDDPGQYVTPAGQTLVEETGEPMAIGGTYAGGVYTPPVQPPPPPFNWGF